MDTTALVREQLERVGISASDGVAARVAAIAEANIPRHSPKTATEPQLVQAMQRWEAKQ